MSKASGIPSLLLALALSGAGYAYWRGEQARRATLARVDVLTADLAANNQLAAQTAAADIASITYWVSRNRNQAKDQAVLSEAQEIDCRSQQLIDTLRAWQRQLRTQAGEAPVGQLRRPGRRGSWSAGQESRLRDYLSRYAAFIHPYTPRPSPLRPPLLPLPAGWLLADHPPLGQALARLTQLERLVRRWENQALRAQAEKVGSSAIRFLRIGLFAVPTSNTVAPGAPYEAALFMTEAASGYKTYMSVNNQPLPVDPATNHGRVEFKVPPARPGQPDTVRAQWQGSIRARLYPRDSTYQVTVPYFIVKRPTR